jgi:hypothetical protein
MQDRLIETAFGAGAANFFYPPFVRGIMEAYCVKCKAKREMKDPKKITMKNGKPATQGTCTKCGTKMFKIGA